MDKVLSALGALLSNLRGLPVWLLVGLGLACLAILYVPPFGGVDPTHFRAEWGVRIWVTAVVLFVLAPARIIDVSVSSARERQKALESGRALRLVPRHQSSWWHLARQTDESFASQIVISIDLTNLTDDPVRIVAGRLVRPRMRSGVIDASVLVPDENSVYSSKHFIPAHDTVTASLQIMVRGVVGRQGEPIRPTLVITDQFGTDYVVTGLAVRTTDLRPPKASLRSRFRVGLHNLRRFGARPPPDGAPVPQPAEWEHQGKFERIDLVLAEERRHYAAKGRSAGQLGSLNVGLQSEPNFGWTTEGSVPALLWNRSQGTPVDSPNLARLLTPYAGLDETERGNLERYLLSHLCKASPYADVAYFIFLALHRMGRTIDALKTARTSLAGDKVHGYSNLLGTLSAIVSHEHFVIEPALYPQIVDVLAGDTEPNFRLIDKITLARLERFDSIDEGV